MRQRFYHKITDIYGASVEHYAEHRAQEKKNKSNPMSRELLSVGICVFNVKGAQGPSHRTRMVE